MDEISRQDFLDLTWEESIKFAQTNPFHFKYFTLLLKLDMIEAKSKKSISFRLLSPEKLKFRLFRTFIKEDINIRSLNEQYLTLISESGGIPKNFFESIYDDYYTLKELQIGKINSQLTDNFFDNQSKYSDVEIEQLKELSQIPNIELDKITFHFIKNKVHSQNILIKSPLAKKRLFQELLDWIYIQSKAKNEIREELGFPITKPKDYVHHISILKKIIARRIWSMLEGCTDIVSQKNKRYSNEQLLIIGKVFVLFEILDTEVTFQENLSSTTYSKYNQYLKQNIKDIIS